MVRQRIHGVDTERVIKGFHACKRQNTYVNDEPPKKGVANILSNKTSRTEIGRVPDGGHTNDIVEEIHHGVIASRGRILLPNGICRKGIEEGIAVNMGQGDWCEIDFA